MKEYIIEKKENQKIMILTDIHFCDSLWHDTPCQDRMEFLCKAVNTEYEQEPFDAILCLGDYSLDFWMWGTMGSYLNTPSVSNTDHFVKQVLPKFPMRPYLIPGNHEQYGEEKWKEITGFPRQYTVVYGDYVFLMLDTFGGDLDPKEHSDGTYTGIDTAFVKKAMAKYPDKTFLLCMHDLIPDRESEEAKQLIRESGQFLCAFAGHIHQSNTLILGKEWNRLPVFYCGDFSYSLGCRNDSAPNWGFRKLDFSDGFNTRYQPCLQLAVGAPWRKN